MKPGDKVWIFFPMHFNEIKECEVVACNENFVNYQIVGEPRERPYTALTSECFPTREALCEYYRKIFE